MSKSKMAFTSNAEAVIEAIKALSQRHATYEVFQDFLEISAIAISNSVDWIQKEEREKRYLEIINQYLPDEQKQLVNIFACLINSMQIENEKGVPTDILGNVFHGLELHNKYRGQFFTPFPVCELMGKISIGSRGKQVIDEEGYISLCEPCIGSGGLVLGFAAAMRSGDMNYQRELCVTACDIDIKCVHMAYLQLSLYGIPAVIIHGNSITLQEWSRWYTPAYMAGQWVFRKRTASIKDIAQAAQSQNVSTQQFATDMAETKSIEFKLLENGQYCLFSMDEEG